MRFLPYSTIGLNQVVLKYNQRHQVNRINSSFHITMTRDHNNGNFWFYFFTASSNSTPSIFGILYRTKQIVIFLFFHNQQHHLLHLQPDSYRSLQRVFFVSTLRIVASSSMINILLISILIISI
jgi:hypothetical protein